MENESITLTPNFDHLFETFTREARIQTERLLESFPAHLYDREQVEQLRAFLSILAPLNVAAQSMTNRAAVERYRELLADITAGIDRKAREIENTLDALETNTEDMQ